MRSYHSLMSVAVAGVCILGFFSGCAKAPDQELAAAKAAMKTAQDAEADKYLPNNFENIQKAMEAAESEIGLQETKLAFSRNYTKAKQLLKNVTDLARQVTVDAPGAKEEMRTRVEEGIASAQKMAKETRVDIKKAPKAKGKKVLAQMAADLDEAENAIAQAAADLSAGNIPDAGKKLGDAQRLLKKIFDKLSSSGADRLM